MKPNRHAGKRDSRVFWSIILALSVVGVALAILAAWRGGNSPGIWDAPREIGGAMVAGAVISGVVVWFEERREEDRVDRETKREKRAELEAWQREADASLEVIVRDKMDHGRTDLLSRLGPISTEKHTASTGQFPASESFDATRGAIRSRLAAMPSVVLLDPYDEWGASFETLRDSYLNDTETTEVEAAAYQQFLDAFDRYIWRRVGFE